MKIFKKIFALGLVVTMVVVLGACDKNVSGLEDVKEKGELEFAVARQNEPFHFKDENGKLVGFDVDLANEIADRLGVEAKAVQKDKDKILSKLISSEYDIVVGSVPITDKTKARVDFTQAYYTDDISANQDAEEFAVAIVKSDQKFVDAVDEAIDEIIEDGTYRDLTQKWFDEDLSSKLK